jgi:hypothetical protein
MDKVNVCKQECDIDECNKTDHGGSSFFHGDDMVRRAGKDYLYLA